MTLEELPVHRLEALLPALEDLRHELGKYVCFEVRFAGGPEAPPDQLRAALRRDLHATRRGPDGVETAWALWARLRPSELDGDADVDAIDALLAELRHLDPEMADTALLARAAGQVLDVAAATRRLVTRARERLKGV